MSPWAWLRRAMMRGGARRGWAAAGQHGLQARTPTATGARPLPAPTGQEQGGGGPHDGHPQSGSARGMGPPAEGPGDIAGVVGSAEGAGGGRGTSPSPEHPEDPLAEQYITYRSPSHAEGSSSKCAGRVSLWLRTKLCSKLSLMCMKFPPHVHSRVNLGTGFIQILLSFVFNLKS